MVNIHIFIYRGKLNTNVEERKQEQMEEKKTITSQNLDFLAAQTESLLQFLTTLQTDKNKKIELIRLVQENELQNMHMLLESSQHHRLKELEGTKILKEFNIQQKLSYPNLLSLFSFQTGKSPEIQNIFPTCEGSITIVFIYSIIIGKIYMYT